MTMRSWIRNVFARPVTRPIRKAPPRGRLGLEALEDRTVPSTFTVLNTNDSGADSLRWAVDQANSTAGADTINFNDGTSPGTNFHDATPDTITLTGGELFLFDAAKTTISGPGQSLLSISGNNASRVFDLNQGASALSGLTITGGNGVGNGGGLFNFGTAWLTDCTITDNSSGAVGGGVGNGGTLTLTNCTVSNNSAGFFGGGLFNGPSGTLTLIGCTVKDNSAGQHGGGVSNYATLTVTDCTFSGNSATIGGGLTNTSDGSSTPTLNMSNSTFSDNSAIISGGGLLNTGGGTATLTNCTFSGNSASLGGGIVNDGAATLNMTSSTVSGNSALEKGGIDQRFGTMTLGNTIVSGNTAPLNEDIGGPINTDLGHNLLGAALEGTTSGPGNVYTDTPLLDALADNGGPTQTRALLPGSPALDAGDNALAVGIATDSRGAGFPRTVNGTVDVGAFESSGLAAATSPFFTALAQAIPGGLTDNGPLAAGARAVGVALARGDVPAAKAALDQLTSDVASAALSGALGTDPTAAFNATEALIVPISIIQVGVLEALGTPLHPALMQAGISGQLTTELNNIWNDTLGGVTGGSQMAADTMAVSVALAQGNVPATVAALNDLFSTAVTAAATPGGGLNSSALLRVLTAAGAIQSLVVDDPTSTSISALDITYGAAGSVTVTVSSMSGTPSGNVALLVDGTQWMTQPLVGGAATFSLPGLSAGNYSLSAFFAAQGAVQGSSFITGNLHVNKAALTITASDSTKVYGTLKTFSGTAFTQTGLINGDTITGVTETSAGAAAAAAPGAYPIVVSDASGTGLDNYDITYVNGLLTVSTPLVVPGAQTAYEDVDKVISGISIGDGASGTLTVTLGVSHGTLTLGTTTGLSVAGNGSGSVTLSGSVAALNAALADLLYRGSHNYSGSDTLSIAVGDGSLSSSGSVAITVKSATHQVTDLNTYIEALGTSGVLNSDQVEALSLILRDNNGDAGKVQAFLNQVAAYLQGGILPPGQADYLLYWGDVLLLGVQR